MAQTLLSKMMEVEDDVEDMGNEVDNLDEGLDDVEAKLDILLATGWAICALLVIVAVVVAGRFCCAHSPPPSPPSRPPRRPRWDVEIGQHRRAEVRPASSLPNTANGEGEWLDDGLEANELGAVGPVWPETSTSAEASAAKKEEEKKGAKKKTSLRPSQQ